MVGSIAPDAARRTAVARADAWVGRSIAERFNQIAVERGNRVAIRTPHGEIRYGALAALSDRIAFALGKRLAQRHVPPSHLATVRRRHRQALSKRRLRGSGATSSRARVPGNVTFLETGGDSLQAMEILVRFRERLGVDMSVADFFALPTVASQARFLEGRTTVDGAAALR